MCTFCLCLQRYITQFQIFLHFFPFRRTLFSSHQWQHFENWFFKIFSQCSVNLLIKRQKTNSKWTTPQTFFRVIRRNRNSYFCSENLWITLPVQNTVTWFLWAVYGKCWLSLQMFGVIRHYNLVVAPPFQAHFHDPIQKQMENLEYDIRHIQQYKIIYSSTISSIY